MMQKSKLNINIIVASYFFQKQLKLISLDPQGGIDFLKQKKDFFMEMQKFSSQLK